MLQNYAKKCDIVLWVAKISRYYYSFFVLYVSFRIILLYLQVLKMLFEFYFESICNQSVRNNLPAAINSFF